MTGVLQVAARGLVWLLVLSHRATGRLADELSRVCGDETTADDDVYGAGWCDLVDTTKEGPQLVEEIDDEVASAEQVDAAIRWRHANTTDVPGGSR